jgi:hypothetical protein
LKAALGLVAIAYAGMAANVWCLSGIVPWFLLPDFGFLAIVYAGLFIPGPSGFLAALLTALFRETTMSAPPLTFLLSSLALYFFTREIGCRLFLRAEPFILATVVGLLMLESLSIFLLLAFTGARFFTLLWFAEEAVRVAWTSLVAVPAFMYLSLRWRQVEE